jgi:hypothetical protein
VTVLALAKGVWDEITRPPESEKAMAKQGQRAGDRMTIEGHIYDDKETEFLAACDRHRRHKRKVFLAATDYLVVLKSLGYRRPEQQQ